MEDKKLSPPQTPVSPKPPTPSQTPVAPPSQPPTTLSPSQSTPPPPPPPQQIASVNLPSESQKNFSLRKKIWLIVLLSFFSLGGIIAGVYLIKQKTEIKPKAACSDWGGMCAPGDKNNGHNGCECDSSCKTTGNKCEARPLDCGGGLHWHLGRSSCSNGACCAESPYHPQYTWVNCNSLPGDYHDCETNPTSLGSCCQDSDGNPYCCWSDGNCSGGQRQGCEDAGGGCIKMPKGTYDVLVCNCGPSYEGSSSPCSENCQWTTRTWNSDGETQCFFGTYECGQADVSNYCASIKNTNCSPPVTITSTPTPTVTLTPTPTVTLTPTPTPTPIPYSCECNAITLYDQNWTEIQPTDIVAGQTIYIAVSGSSGYPEYEFDKGRIRVNKLTWDNYDETTQQVPGHPNQFYITYLIPANGGTFTIEGEIHLNATITDPEGANWWR